MAPKVFRHLGLKFLAIALAALMWVLVSGERVVERALRIPLEFTNLPAHLELVGDTPTVVDVRVRGSSGALSRVAAGELVAVLDLQSARAGLRLFHITGADVRAPFGIEVVQITPSNVSMAFEESASKIVPVVPEVAGDPAEGYVVGAVRADPATVEVVGPASAVERLTAAITEPVSVAGASGPVTESVNVGVPDPSVRLGAPQSARVRVEVAAAPVDWAVAAVPVRIRNGVDVAEIGPSQVTVHVRGPREARAYGTDAFEATIDVEGLGAGQFQLPVRLVPPPRVGVVRVEPADVRVRIR
ncbi:MAG: YbbR-like domain-containing protein [Acidobacteria bacterium]|nr:YbbR-like domain-containing protein [Acidobacteriota bacterium]